MDETYFTSVWVGLTQGGICKQCGALVVFSGGVVGRDWPFRTHLEWHGDLRAAAAMVEIVRRCWRAKHATEWNNHAYNYVPTVCDACQQTIDEVEALVAAMTKESEAHDRQVATRTLMEAASLSDVLLQPGSLYPVRATSVAHLMDLRGMISGAR